MNNPELAKSKNLKIALSIVGLLLIMFISFAGGVKVGLRKAKFSYQWGQNYERNFMGASFRDGGMMQNERGGMMNFPRNIEGRDFRNAHGLAGTIISISDNNLVVKDRDNKESTIAVTEKTIIKDHMADVKITDLKTNDQIVVMGKPSDSGVISADLIRVFCCSGADETDNGDND
jgi:hypothetical protein